MSAKPNGISVRTARVGVLLVLIGLIGGLVYWSKPSPEQISQKPPAPAADTIDADNEQGPADTLTSSEQPPPVEPEDLQPEPEKTNSENNVVVGPGVQQTAEEIDFATAMAAGDAALEEDRLLRSPDGQRGAMNYYYAAWKQEPESADALAALELVGAQLRRRLATAVVSEDFQLARRYLSELEEAVPPLASVAELRISLDKARTIAEARMDLEATLAADPVDPQTLWGAFDQLRLLDEDAAQRYAVSVQSEQLANFRREMFNDQFLAARQWLLFAEDVRPESTLNAEARRDWELATKNAIDQIVALADEQKLAGKFSSAANTLSTITTIVPDSPRLTQELELLAQFQLTGPFSVGEEFADSLNFGGAAGPQMIVLPPGVFVMGSNAAGAAERPARSIQIPVGFALGKTEVRVGDFRLFVEGTGYQTDAERAGRSLVYNERNGRMVRRRGVSWRKGFDGAPAEDDLPVMHVSWNDAVAYAAWLSNRTGASYRLPSEAEFEYALRAGTTTRYWWGSDVAALESESLIPENLTGAQDRSRRGQKWNRAIAGYADGFFGPAPVGSLMTNPFGLYDMASNLSEWVLDCWHDNYRRAPVTAVPWVNPGCKNRVVRGDYWGGDWHAARSTFRSSASADYTTAAVGFRLVREIVPETID